MTKIQIRKGKKGITYKVEFMRDGFRASKTFKLKKEAQQFSASITLNHDLALSLTNSPQNKITLRTAVDDYFSQYTGKDKIIKGRLKWWCKFIGDLEISKIDRRTVKTGLQRLLDEGKSCATHNRYKSAISSVFEFMRDEYDTNHNPAREVKQLTEKANKERYCSKTELATLLEKAKESDWNLMYMVILMAITTGARRGELLKLQWQDIDFKNKTAYLYDTKNGDNRVLPLTVECVEELKRFKQSAGFIFPRIDNPSVQRTNFDHYWRKCLKSAKIEGLRFHDLRHTCGSWLAMNDVPLKAIAEILGHKTIQTTQRYVHHSTSHKAVHLNRVFGGIS